MPVTININGLSLVHQGSGAIAIADLPDVCKTPTPIGPIPLPYPNIAKSDSLVGGTTTVFVDGGMPAAVQSSSFALSDGDQAGAAGGIISSIIMGKATWLTYSFDVKFEGKGVCRLTDKMFMNQMNTACLSGVIQPPVVAQDGPGTSDPEEKEKRKKERPPTESLRVRIDIDPEETSSWDDKFILTSTDNTFNQTKTIKDDKVTGDNYVDLEFDGLKEGKKYSLQVNPGKEGKPYYIFKAVPFEDLYWLSDDLDVDV